MQSNLSLVEEKTGAESKSFDMLCEVPGLSDETLDRVFALPSPFKERAFVAEVLKQIHEK